MFFAKNPVFIRVCKDFNIEKLISFIHKIVRKGGLGEMQKRS